MNEMRCPRRSLQCHSWSNNNYYD